MRERGITASIIRRWWLVVAVAVTVGVVAVLAGGLRPVRHESSVRFFVKESLLTASGTLGTPYSQVQSNQDWHALVAPLSSGSVVKAAAEEAGVSIKDTAEFLDSDFEVTTEDMSHVSTLRVTVEGTAAQADAFANSMLRQLEATLTAQYTEAIDARIAATEAEIETAWKSVRVLPGTGGATVEFPVSGGTDAYGALLRQASDLRIARASLFRPVEMLTPATSEQVQPSPLRDLLAGAAIGLLAGIAVALILDARDLRRGPAAADAA